MFFVAELVVLCSWKSKIPPAWPWERDSDSRRDPLGNWKDRCGNLSSYLLSVLSFRWTSPSVCRELSGYSVPAGFVFPTSCTSFNDSHVKCKFKISVKYSGCTGTELEVP